MKIAFFETSADDEVYLKSRLGQEHELYFTKETLSRATLDLAKDCECISVFIYSPVTEDLLQELPALRFITTRSTGFDHIDMIACEKRGISVANVPHYGENTVAEHTFALILALSRNVHKSYTRGLKGDFSIEGLIGFDLKDKTLGVIGTGRIGLHVIRIAKGFGMHVIAHDTNHDIFLSEILHYRYAPLVEVLSQSDIVTLHVPYNTATHHLINRDTLQEIKQGALIINTSRGGIVDNDALIDALDAKRISGVGLDVLEGEESIKEENQCVQSHDDCNPAKARQLKQNHALLSRDNVVFTPHIGFYSGEALRRILDTTIHNITTFAHDESAPQVNHP
jgi:D-lactate dehydrogenase